MQKQIQNIDNSIKKVEKGMVECLEGKYENNSLIYQLLEKKEKILNKTRKKLIKLNMNNLINFQEIK